MQVYLDVLFIENAIMTFCIILEGYILLNKKTRIRRAICASIVSAIYVVVLVICKLDEPTYLLCQMLLMIVVTYVSYLPKTYVQMLKAYAVIYMVTIINGGILSSLTQFFQNKYLQYALGLIIAHMTIKALYKIYTLKSAQLGLNKQVKIKLNNKEYEYCGFVDTGNTVYSHELNLPVCFAEYKEEIGEALKLEPARVVYVSTLNSRREYRAYKVDAEIDKKAFKMGVIFIEEKLSKKEEYDMILNYKLFTNEMGGISCE